ncbi:MAG: ATP-dependent 6-phosphofructokinase [Rickettsiales bacterium]|jgi:6-phosphofructokinase 1|nr:ATP-dependent 6-phosphofructokinase [Rickettsiales bacterium]
MSKKQIRKVGIFTSGGDCSGLNAVITAAIKTCEVRGIEVFAIYNGTDGLLYNNLKSEKISSATLLRNNFTPMRTGGTILKSKNRDKNKNNVENYKDLFREGAAKLGMDSIIVIGGDGSATITADLVKDTDINIICIPKTIDNDTPITDYSIGFDTARTVTMEAMDKLQTTAYSHDRILILEVMGRDAGHLALHTAIAGEACVCLLPEISYNLDNVCKKLDETLEKTMGYALIVVAEGCKTLEGENAIVDKNGIASYTGFSNYICQKLTDKGYNNRNSILGHIQRGGIPTAYDRILAAQFATHAVDLLCDGKDKRLVILKDGKISDVDLYEAVASANRPVKKDDDLVKTARKIGIYVGEDE